MISDKNPGPDTSSSRDEKRVKKRTLHSCGHFFDERKAVKVSGVSQLLRDLIEKEFHTRRNSAKYSDDVNKLYVCPDGQDCVLVEFRQDIPGNFGAVYSDNMGT